MVVKSEEEDANEEGVAEKEEGRDIKRRTKGMTRRSRKRRKKMRKGSEGGGEKVVNEMVINCLHLCGGAIMKQSETLNCAESPGSETLFKTTKKAKAF